jgi:hypothetical protein
MVIVPSTYLLFLANRKRCRYLIVQFNTGLTLGVNETYNKQAMEIQSGGNPFREARHIVSREKTSQLKDQSQPKLQLTSSLFGSVDPE